MVIAERPSRIQYRQRREWGIAKEHCGRSCIWVASVMGFGEESAGKSWADHVASRLIGSLEVGGNERHRPMTPCLSRASTDIAAIDGQGHAGRQVDCVIGRADYICKD